VGLVGLVGDYADAVIFDLTGPTDLTDQTDS
jgi:hypothetical protein